MTDINQFHDSLNVQQQSTKKIPDMLNVLSILSFIGCAIGLLGSIYNHFAVCKSVEMMERMSDTDNPMAGMMGAAAEAAVKQCEMRVPLLILGLLCIVLCFVGVLQMRKLKKTGFYLYTIGELGAPVAMLALLGGTMLSSPMMLASTIFSVVISVVFVVLYATQLKHMN